MYAVTTDCTAPETLLLPGGPELRLHTRCELDKDCPSGSQCLAGQNPATNTQDLFCFKDAGR